MLSDTQDYQILQADDARAAAQRVGIDVDFLFADYNGLTQIQQLFARIQATPDQRPLAIVVESMAADGLPRVARTCAEQGVGWIIVSSDPPYLAELRREFPRLVLASATVDELAIGAIQAKQFRALLPEGGRVLYIEGPPNSHATIGRRHGMENGISGSAIKLEKTLTCDWSEANAERVMHSWLKLTLANRVRPDLIGVQSDPMAIGVRRAIAATRPEWLDIPITGVDGLPHSGQRLVNDGVLAATVVKPSTTGSALELIARAIRGERTETSITSPVLSFPPIEEIARRMPRRR
jgi:ABC-type sugar transport system substrate-binding protein